MPLRRLPHSTATREKLRRAATGRKHSPEAKAKIAAARTGRKHSPETIAKITEERRARKRTDTPEACLARHRAMWAETHRVRRAQMKRDVRVAYDMGRWDLVQDVVRSGGVWGARRLHHPELSDGIKRGVIIWGSPRNLDERVRLGHIKGYIRTNRKAARRAGLQETR